MKTIIYYFTGTGNSLQVASDLGNLIENTTLSCITDKTVIDANSECIGFVLPVYLWGVPDIVENFLLKLPDNMKDKYLFAVATYKSQTGDINGQIKKLLNKTHNTLSSAFSIQMPGNNIIYYSLEPEEVQNQKLQNCEKQLNQIAEIIKNKQKTIDYSYTFKDKLLTSFVHKALLKSFSTGDKNFWINENCSHCGLCSQICPVGNISIQNGIPTWNHNCQQCVACINCCPTNAIQYGKTTEGKKRYINKKIGVDGLKGKR